MWSKIEHNARAKQKARKTMSEIKDLNFDNREKLAEEVSDEPNRKHSNINNLIDCCAPICGPDCGPALEAYQAIASSILPQTLVPETPTTPPAGDRQHVPTDQAAPEPCAGCGQPTDGMCWTDCGMSLCGAPLCGNCCHVDEKFGWRHEPRAKGGAA